MLAIKEENTEQETQGSQAQILLPVIIDEQNNVKEQSSAIIIMPPPPKEDVTICSSSIIVMEILMSAERFFLKHNRDCYQSVSTQVDLSTVKK